MEDKYITISEIAIALHCDKNTVRNFIKKGQLTAFKGGRCWLVEKNDLDNFIENRKQLVLQKVQAERNKKCQSTCVTTFGKSTLRHKAVNELDDLLKPKTK